VAAMQARIDALDTELQQGRDREAAIAEVLGVINSSPGDLTPVFEAMLEKAVRLCQAEFGTLWTYDGERLHAVGIKGVPAGFAEFVREPIGAADSAVYAAIVEGQGFVQVADLADSDAYRQGHPLRPSHC